MITRSIQAKILVFAVFFVGMISGVLLGNFYDARVRGDHGDREDHQTQMRQRAKNFEDSLNLSPEQKSQMEQILDETRGEFRKLNAQTRPQCDAIRKQSEGRIRAILNDEQQRKHDEFIQSRKQRHERHN